MLKEKGKVQQCCSQLRNVAALTSRCSLQILHSQMGWGRLLVVSTPHLVQTFCRERENYRGAEGRQTGMLGLGQWKMG